MPNRSFFELYPLAIVPIQFVSAVFMSGYIGRSLVNSAKRSTPVMWMPAIFGGTGLAVLAMMIRGQPFPMAAIFNALAAGGIELMFVLLALLLKIKNKN